LKNENYQTNIVDVTGISKLL